MIPAPKSWTDLVRSSTALLYEVGSSMNLSTMAQAMVMVMSLPTLLHMTLTSCPASGIFFLSAPLMYLSVWKVSSSVTEKGAKPTPKEVSLDR